MCLITYAMNALPTNDGGSSADTLLTTPGMNTHNSSNHVSFCCSL